MVLSSRKPLLPMGCFVKKTAFELQRWHIHFEGWIDLFIGIEGIVGRRDR